MILIIDDDRSLVGALRALLDRAGYEVATAFSPDEAINVVRRAEPRLVLMDMNFGIGTSGEDGLALLRQVRIFRPDVPVILMTAWGNIDLAVAGMRAGACDFITKPWDVRRLLSSIADAISLRKPAAESRCDDGDAFEGIVGRSEALRGVLDTVRRVAPTSAPVLITGESGTGKELVARAIHRLSPRSDGPFVQVNLGGIPASLFESEMFGHVRGAFTGALADRTGRFGAADGGTIFLDEIGELDAASQVKMLRVLQEQTFEPLGSSRTRRVDVRVVCATNADLPAMVASGTFREDLYYRINLVGIHMPPLRSRGGDIALLASHFAAAVAPEYGLAKVPEFTADACRLLESLPFPGNIRELKNLVERTVLLGGSDVLTAEHLRACLGESVTHKADVTAGTLDEIERARVEKALRDAGGNISRAAVELGLSRGALYRRMEKYGL